MSKLAHSNQETMNKIESQSCKYQDIEDIVVAVIDSNVETVTFKETVGHCAREIIAAIYTHSETDAQSVPVEPKFREFRGCLKPVDRGMWVNGPSNFYSASEVDAAIETLQSALKLAQEELHIVFDGPPSHESGRFVEVETADGKSVNVGRWEQRGEYWHLILGGKK